jgi:hypothetical protein
VSAEGVRVATVKDALLGLAGTARTDAVSAISRLPAASVAIPNGFAAEEDTVVVALLCRLNR